MTDLIDFGIGQPSLALLPVDALRAAAAHELARLDPALLQYGDDQGDEGCRTSLAVFLARRYAVPVHAAQLMITTGVSQALDLICTRFTHPGDTIFVEAPTYFLALDIFRDHGLKVVAIPIDEDGMRLDSLREALAIHRPVLLYTIPAFQNPSGVTMSAARRDELVAICREHDLLIVADEVYHLLDFGSAPPLPLASYSHDARILSLGSFSKICAPGLRLGWVQGAQALLERLMHSGLVQSGGGLNPFTSGIVRSMIDLGHVDSGLEMLRGVYRERSATLCQALREALPSVTFHEPRGGYFVWVQLPASLDAAHFRPIAMSEQVAFHAGRRFVTRDEAAQPEVVQSVVSCMRFSFAHYEPDTLVEGVHRLARAVDRYRAEASA